MRRTSAKRLWLSALTVICSLYMAHAQDNSTPTLRVQTRLVTVDTLVHDHDGNPVRHLTADQFHLFEDGVEQKITHFEEHAGDRPSPTKPLPKLPPHVYTNYPMVQASESVTILLLDKLNTPLKDQVFAQQQMIAYLRQQAGSDKLAIFVLGSELRLLQGFSSDPGVLLAAINSKKAAANTPASAGLNDRSDLDDPGNAVAEEGLASIMQSFEQNTEAFRADVRMLETVNAFQQIAAYLDGFPGRKSVIWFSGAFPVSLMPNEVSANVNMGQGMAITPNLYATEIARTINILTAEQVAIYPVDVGGLEPPTAFSAKSSGAGYVRNSRAVGNSISNDLQQNAAAHSSMKEIAESTGGFATYNTNDLKDALTRILRDNENYYSLAYTPKNRTEDGSFRNIRVVADVKKVEITYRRGYYSNDPAQPTITLAAAGAPSDAPRPDAGLETLNVMMRRGAPDATQILFKVKVSPPVHTEAVADLPVSTDGKGTVPEQIDWAIDLHSVAFQNSEDGHKHASLLISAVAYDASGQPLQADRQRLLLDMNPEQYARAMRFGLQQHRTIQIPAGDVFLHLGILDETSQAKGATEIPLRIAP